MRSKTKRAQTRKDYEDAIARLKELQYPCLARDITRYVNNLRAGYRIRSLRKRKLKNLTQNLLP